MRDVESFSRFERPLLQAKRNRELESVCNFLPRKEFCPHRNCVHEFLEKKPDQAYQGEFAAQTRLSEAQAESDRRECEMRNADIALYETGMQLQSQRMELDEANQLTYQTRREQSWQCDELEMRNRAFQEKIVQEVAKKLKNCAEFAVQRLQEFDN